MDRLTIETPRFLVLAEGATSQARASAQGALFEKFIALLLVQFGYEDPTRESLNVTSRGIELDVVAHHELSGQQAIIECKAYSTSVDAGELDKFYGKLQIGRFRDPNLLGMFFAIPGLSPQGTEQAREIAEQDRNFSLFTAGDIADILTSKTIISPTLPTDARYADFAVAITEEGIFSAAKEIDDETRTPLVVRVWSSQTEATIPGPVLDLLSVSDYASETPVVAQVQAAPPKTPLSQDVNIVEVTGSTSDFEYQLPASPRFFVGRRLEVEQLDHWLGDSRGGVIVINAQSGWGKSSLALRLERGVYDKHGVALIVDARTASSPEFVWRVLARLADTCQGKGLLTLEPNAAFSSLPTSLAAFRDASWEDPVRPVLVFFDQFENVFRDSRLTREFRDLALSVRELPYPLTVAFAWKTDLIGWTEGHPYQLRDDIRGSGSVLAVGPLGPPEVSTLLRRLEKAAGVKIASELKQRLREYSQGLPWLFKKLANHILSELQAGTSQEELLAEALNVQTLFENDMAELGPAEQEALRAIAKNAPMLASEASDLVSNDEVLQSLIDRRLLVQVGERLDTYWDIFRDFLNTGRIPIQDTYILRQTPAAVSRLLRAVVQSDGDISVASAAKTLRTSEGVVFNLARDLRLLGVLSAVSGRVRIAADLREADDLESAVRQRISASLRRHRAFSLLSQQVEELGGSVSLHEFAATLPEAFPAVEAKPNTWAVYSRAFAWWFVYARLVAIGSGRITLGEPSENAIELLREGLDTIRVRNVFPQSQAGPALDVARLLAGQPPHGGWTDSGFRKAVNDLVLLGFADVEPGSVTPREDQLESLFDDSGEVNRELLRAKIEVLPGAKPGLALLDSDPSTPAMTVGEVLRKAYEAEWAASTTAGIGKYFRSWAREAGISGIAWRPRKST